MIHFAQRQKERLSHCGGPKDILRKIRNKSHQKSLMESFGTGSFPRRGAEEERGRNGIPLYAEDQYSRAVVE